jgi:hypothetical protein
MVLRTNRFCRLAHMHPSSRGCMDKKCATGAKRAQITRDLSINSRKLPHLMRSTILKRVSSRQCLFGDARHAASQTLTLGAFQRWNDHSDTPFLDSIAAFTRALKCTVSEKNCLLFAPLITECTVSEEKCLPFLTLSVEMGSHNMGDTGEKRRHEIFFSDSFKGAKSRNFAAFTRALKCTVSETKRPFFSETLHYYSNQSKEKL